MGPPQDHSYKVSFREFVLQKSFGAKGRVPGDPSHDIMPQRVVVMEFAEVVLASATMTCNLGDLETGLYAHPALDRPCRPSFLSHAHSIPLPPVLFHVSCRPVT